MENKIPMVLFDGVNVRDYFERLNKDQPALPIRKRSCSDCAVKFGLYKQFSDYLAEEDLEFQKYHSERWFCHSTPNKACAGNWRNLRILNKAEEGSNELPI